MIYVLHKSCRLVPGRWVFTQMRQFKQKLDSIIEYAEPNLPVIGLFGSVGYPLFYITWKYLFPQPYEDLPMRLAAAVIALPWLLYPNLSKRVKEYFPYYFFVTALLLLPFFFHYMLLKNGWSDVWIMSSMAGLLLLILIINDWILVCCYTLAGFVLAYFVVLLTDGYVSYANFNAKYIPVYLFVLIGGLIADSRRLAATRTKLSLMKSLSGSIAHEMRNPLMAITNAMGTMQSIIPQKPEKSDESETYVLKNTSLISMHDIIDESLSTIKRGNKIIDSILVTLQDGLIDMSNFKKIGVKNATHTAITNYGYHDQKERDMVIEKTSGKFDFLGDKDLFIYVLFNLIKNALHYKDKPGFNIEISTEAGTIWNYVRVRDTGPGIPASKRDIIFDRFYTSGKSGGNGLGLSFCRRVIESFGGTITCDSEEGSWTEFTIKLPGYNSSKTVYDLKREILKVKKVLIVDDQLTNRLLLMKHVSEWNCPYDQVDNARQALNMMSKNCYDLVFMDFEMPYLTGDNAVTMIRQAQGMKPAIAQRCSQVPIVGVTALPLDEAIPRAAACGMNEVIPKPIKNREITRVFERYFFSETPSLSAAHEELLSNARILLVDDNETSRKFMSLILEHYGCSIGQAENGKEAIEQLDAQDYDLVLMDMEMPVMNGVETTVAIRSGTVFSRFGGYESIPIVALTGNTDPESVSAIKAAGMNHYMSKPIFRDELVSTIANWLKNGHMLHTSIEGEKEAPKLSSEETWAAISNESTLDRSIINGLLQISDHELMFTLLDVFINDATNLIKGLEVAADTGNLSNLDKITHTLKGSSASIGANRLFVLFKHLNDLARKGEWPDHVNWLGIVRETYEHTIKEMSMFISNDASGSKDASSS